MINQSNAGRFDPKVFVNCVQEQYRNRTCTQVTKTKAVIRRAVLTSWSNTKQREDKRMKISQVDSQMDIVDRLAGLPSQCVCISFFST